MKTAPFLIAAVLLFWGLTHGPVTLPAAVVLALLLEGSRWIPWRWELTETRMISIGNVCLIILAGTFAIFYLETREQAVPLLFTWLPVILAPLMAAQAYSIKEKTSIRVFFPSLRWQAAKARKAGVEPSPDPEIDLSYWYFGLVLISATVSNSRSLWPFVLLMLLLCATLFLDQTSGIGNRPEKASGENLESNRAKDRRGFFSRFKVHPALLGFLLLLIVGAGWSGPIVLYGIQRQIEQLPFFRPDMPSSNLGLANTRIGDFYDSKQSGKILYRLKPRGRSPVPTLLQEAGYSEYFNGSWRAAVPELKQEVEAVPESPEPGVLDISIWKLQFDENRRVLPGRYSFELSGRLSKKDEGHFPLPAGVTRLWELPATTVTYNGYGTVQVTGGNSPFEMNVDYSPRLRLDGDPHLLDVDWKHAFERTRQVIEQRPGQLRRLKAHKEEMNTLAQLAEDLGLKDPALSETQKVRIIQDFFRDNFSYSLNLKRPARYNSDRPLTEFLTRIQKGHCEYFGTATTLLLREAGIPARYVVGFSVQEYSDWEKAWVVRSMHGHAWSMAYLGGEKIVDEDGTIRWEGGEWIDIDTTPSAWADLDTAGLPGWQPVKDFFAALWHQFDLWRAEGGFQKLRPYIPWIMGLALLLVGGGSLFGHTRRHRRKKGGGEKAPEPIEIPHELERLEHLLAERGYPRGSGETSACWLRRLAREAIPGLTGSLAGKLIDVHYRDRFSPTSISDDERQGFRRQVNTILQAVSTAKT